MASQKAKATAHNRKVRRTRKVSASVVKMAEMSSTKTLGKEGHADGDDEGRDLTEDGVLPGAMVVFGTHFVADDDGRRQADAPGNGIGQGREADGGWLAAR